MAINPAQFDAVVDALRRVLPCERPADAVLSAYFRDMRKLGAQDRHLIAETIFAVLRRLLPNGMLDAVLRRVSRGENR